MPKLFFSDVREAYERYMEPIYAFFAAKLLDKKTAEDLTSETFVTFVKHVKNNTEIENIRAYLYGIARNVFLLHLRRKYKISEVSYQEFDDFAVYTQAVVEKSKSKSLEDRLLPLIDMLPEMQKEIIRMRLIEKCSLSDIVAKLGKDMNYVKTTQKRAIKKLRELVACTP